MKLRRTAGADAVCKIPPLGSAPHILGMLVTRFKIDTCKKFLVQTAVLKTARLNWLPAGRPGLAGQRADACHIRQFLRHCVSWRAGNCRLQRARLAKGLRRVGAAACADSAMNFRSLATTNSQSVPGLTKGAHAHGSRHFADFLVAWLPAPVP